MATAATAPRTRRDQRREATKAAVLEAARTVFLTNGFDGATIKMIADAAGVSPGTVLNAAPTKAQLLVEILNEEYGAIRDSAQLMEAALSGAAVDRLTALMQVSLEGWSRHPELFSAAIGHSWLASEEAFTECYRQMDFAWEPVQRILARAVEAGELRADLNARAATELLQDVYLGVFRRARHEDLDFPTVSRLLRQRLVMIFNGFAAGR